MIREALFFLCRKITPWQLVHADQNAPRPGVAHATLRYTLAGVPDHDEDIVGTRAENGELTGDKVRGNRTLVVTLQFFGPGALEEGLKATLRASSHTVNVEAQRHGLAMGRKISYVNTTGMFVGADKEERASFEFEVLSSLVIDEDFGAIEKVQADGTLTGGASEDVPCDIEIVIVNPIGGTLGQP